MKISSLTSQLSIFLSLKLFSKRLPLSYSLFNYFFDKLKNKENLNKSIEDFENNGFSKIDYCFSHEVDEIKNKLSSKIRLNEGRENYNINLEQKSQFADIIIKKLNPFLLNLEKYFNSRPVLVDLNVWKNHFFKKDLTENDKDLIAESFHNDGYLCNYLKIHINFEDVDLNKGPMNIIKKGFNKKFRNDVNYLGRSSYNKDDLDNKNYLYKNIGKKGDALLFDPTEVFHRATIPNKNFTRTMMEIILYIPRKKIENVNQILNFNTKYKSLTKPHSIKQVFSYLRQYKALKLKKS